MRFVFVMLLLAGCGSAGPAVEATGTCAPLEWSGETPADVATHTYEGQLWQSEGTDAAEQTEHFAVLTLTKPVCGEDGDAVYEIQLYATDAAVRAQLERDEQRVRVTGAGFAEHTAHHHRPMVVEVTALDAL